MTEASSAWIEAGDGLRIFRREWRGAEERAAMLYVHGLASHSGWIDDLALGLAAGGLAVHACDLRGHGRTGPAPGQLPGPGPLLRDLDRCFDALSERFPDLPHYVMGTSLGGCLATSFSARRGGALAGLVLISPAFAPIYLSAAESTRILIDPLVGGRLAVATPRARGLLICGSPEVRRRLGEDPLSLATLPARAHLSALQILSRARRDLVRVTVPVLCLQGARDPVVSADWNRRRFEHRPNTTFVWVPEGYHDLGLEPEVGKVDERILGWIAETLPVTE